MASVSEIAALVSEALKGQESAFTVLVEEHLSAAYLRLVRKFRPLQAG